MSSRQNPTSKTNLPVSQADPQAAQPCCQTGYLSQTPGEVRCPVCYHLIPPEHIGYKLHCRRCGYLESCCNPI
ncbi:MAG TPA: hypothetical protein VFB38_17225 [Chthonomonadaceae bacterium]|nr:hypothetical protein [Chthonomonadaceae bacterium]